MYDDAPAAKFISLDVILHPLTANNIAVKSKDVVEVDKLAVPIFEASEITVAFVESSSSSDASKLILIITDSLSTFAFPGKER